MTKIQQHLQANKGNNANKQIMDMVENGLNLTNKKIVNAADNQNMVVDESGLLMREKNEFGDDYSAEQTKIINHGFYYTNDGWKTVKTGLGKYIYYDPETGTYKEDYGIIAHKIVGNIILGNELGIYNTSGSVKIDQNGMTITADAADTNKDLFTLQRKNEDGSYTKYVYVDDDGNIKINGRHIQMTTSDDLGSYIDKTIKQEAAALVVQLTNEYIGITTDSNGNGGNFADCYTDVLVFSGSTDITKSSDLKWTITATSGIEGEWDKTLHRYTIKNLTTNMGEVVFDLIYMDKLSVSKKFRIAKLKAGADGGQGIQGIPGRDGVDGTSSYIHIKYSPVENPTDEMLTEVPAAYIGICVDTNLNDPTTASSYTWSRFNGKDGKDGTPGTNGRDGTDSYVHFAYAQSSDGSVNFIEDVKSAKIAAMSVACNEVITQGFDITLSDKKSHHFSLEVADQLKISKLNDRANAGVTVLPYHADGESCKFYSKEDVVALNTAMENRIEFQTTYFNSLRDYIESMTDINDICAVEYGIDIPEAYQSEVLKMLYSQMQKEN